MLRILYVIPNLRKGGAERLVLDICTEMQKRPNVAVKLITLHPENEYKFLSDAIDIELCNSHISPSISKHSQIDITAFNRIVSEFKPDIIHSHLFEAEMVSRWQLFTSIRYFTHCHDNLRQFRRLTTLNIFNKVNITEYYERILLFRNYRQCNNQFIAISKDTKAFLKENLPISLRRINLLPNAINYGRFRSDKIRNAVGEAQIRIINVGSFVPKKNQRFLLIVVRILKDKGFNVRLDLLGDGVNRSKLEKEIDILNLTENIYIHGVVHKVEDNFKESDIYVHSATNESFGLVLIEAMAAGLPVVSLDGGGNRDIIENGKNGFLVESQNAEIFAEKIIELIENPELYSKMSVYAREYAKKYDIEPYVDKLLDLYQNVL